MNRRFLLMVKKPSGSLSPNQGMHDHIAYVAEYEDRYFAGFSDSQLRRKFRDRSRNVEKGNPTRHITMEYIRDERAVDVDTRTKVFSALFSAYNPGNTLLFLALSKEKLEADVLAHVRNFQEGNEVELATDYEEACGVLQNVLGADLTESEHILP